MNRTRDYYRKMRAKHIRRKKEISSHYCSPEFPWYRVDGKYSKGKIHCSCPLCSSKAYYKGNQQQARSIQQRKHDYPVDTYFVDEIYE